MSFKCSNFHLLLCFDLYISIPCLIASWCAAWEILFSQYTRTALSVLTPCVAYSYLIMFNASFRVMFLCCFVCFVLVCRKDRIRTCIARLHRMSPSFRHVYLDLTTASTNSATFLYWRYIVSVQRPFPNIEEWRCIRLNDFISVWASILSAFRISLPLNP